MGVASILTILVLDILLPTADIITDLNLAVKLYKPLAVPGCVLISMYLIDYNSWEDCWEDRVEFCSKNENRKYCYFSHYKLATVLLMPCLLNYIVCFYTFFRLTPNRKKYLFIFPLLNLYPQYGKTHSN